MREVTKIAALAILVMGMASVLYAQPTEAQTTGVYAGVLSKHRSMVEHYEVLHHGRSPLPVSGEPAESHGNP